MIRRRLRISLLAVLLVLIQSEHHWHHLDLAAHADDQECELCLALGAMAHGLPVAPPHLPAMGGVDVYLPALQPSLLETLAVTPYRTRAPPSSLPG